jgi:hypothetical protein
MTVSRKLDAISESRRKIADELKGIASVALANEPARNKFGIWIECNPGPNVAYSETALHLFSSGTFFSFA